MAGKAIGKSMNFGFAGNYARTPDDIVASRKLAEDSAVVPFGAAVAVAEDNTYKALAADFKAEDFGGIALRVVKQAVAYDDMNHTAYQPGVMMSALQRGATTVVCNAGEPKANGKVYVRIKENGSVANGVIGGFEAEADGANTVELPNVKWTNGILDANRIAEVTILTRVNP